VCHVVAGDVQRIRPVDDHVEAAVAQAPDPLGEGPEARHIGQGLGLHVLGAQGRQDAHRRHAPAVGPGRLVQPLQQLLDLGAQSREGRPGQGARRGHELQVEAVELYGDALVVAGLHHLEVAEKGAPVGVHQAELHLRPHRGRALAEAGSGHQLSQGLEVLLEQLDEVLVVGLVEVFAVDVLAHRDARVAPRTGGHQRGR